MARARTIKPGIMTNEELCELGPMAYILFTSLWMVADREGRLEDRPRRIKAQAMPLWDISAQDVENLLESLATKQFISRYQVAQDRYIVITNWRKHQHPHPNESPSQCPPPSASSNGSARSKGRTKARPRYEGLHTKVRTTQAIPSIPSGSSLAANARASATASDHEENPPPPPPKPTEPGPRRKLPNREATSTRTTNNGQPPRRGKQPTPNSFWPHTAEDVALVRTCLDSLAQIVHLAPPDEDILRRVLDAGRGASAAQIVATLRVLHQRRRFDEMHSWGLVPLVVRDAIRAA